MRTRFDTRKIISDQPVAAAFPPALRICFSDVLLAEVLLSVARVQQTTTAGRKINAREMVQINDFFEISYRSTIAIAHESAKAPRARNPRMNFSVLTYCTPKKAVRGNRCMILNFWFVEENLNDPYEKT